MVKIEKTHGKLLAVVLLTLILDFKMATIFNVFLAYIYISQPSKQIKREALNLGEEEDGFAR